ncbi:MAG: 5'-methylthioadenosine/adenosylhomocysteine nucleosidase [Clostridia bacterium]|nr:5'-methylthioadenosine/adenosylhomocysteine nucleosidase [Clostridia bacterium]
MKLGIIAAMTIEAELIVASMNDPIKEKCGGIEYTLGKIGDIDVICAVCGVGKVFAAMCAQAMIVRYSPDCIVNTGVGGTLTRELSIGDVAISHAVVQHDMDTSPLGDPVGLISGINIIEIPASVELGEKICKIAERSGVKTLCGTIASGDRFVADADVKKRIVDNFGAVVCEMEGAAVGQVCYVNGVPFVVVRAVSDDADGGACEDYPTFAKKSAEVSAKIIVELANSL